MLTGKELGAAIEEAMRLKKVSRQELAEHFGVKRESTYDWTKHGRIGKQHLTRLVRYFSGVVGLAHWGLSADMHLAEDPDWPSVLAYAQAVGLGTGFEADEYAEMHKLKFRHDSLAKKHLNPNNLRVMQGNGDSMEPAIRDGDAILFDLSDIEPRNNRIYVLTEPGVVHDEYNVKRCKISKGLVTFVADNPNGDHNWKEPRTYGNPLDPFTIVGRVRWIGRWIK